MAKCDLAIELDDPDRVYPGGSRISGVVRVRADADVRCNGLEVSSGWRTHGRGNIASDVAATKTLFEGEWKAGELVEYRFDLPVSQWPPTYHGHYLNVDHYIDARAKIPWSFDPKASAPYLMTTDEVSSTSASSKNVTEISGTCGCVIAAVIAAVFLGVGGVAAVATFPFGLIIVVGIGGAAFLFWLFKVFLPKHLLGEVKHFLAEEKVVPGQSVEGELTIRPRRNVQINGVTLELEACEKCISGSGSNRKTHKHVLFEQLITLQDATTLSAGQEHRFPLNVTLPDDAPYSIDLDDNDLIWKAKLRVDIPRWPDWTVDLDLTVVPGVASDSEATSTRPSTGDTGRGVGANIGTGTGIGLPASEAPGTPAEEMIPTEETGITFDETARHLWESRREPDQIEMLVEAVTGLSFAMEVTVERRLLYGGDEDPHVYEDGYSVWAHYPEPKLPMVLYVPHELADEFENIGRDQWRGKGTVVGWDSRHRRLQVKVERPRA